MKSLKKHSIFLIIFSIIVIFISIKDDFFTTLKLMINTNYRWLLVAAVFIFAYWFFKALALYEITKNYTNKVSFKKILRQIIITQFFNGVTPFSAGGQPMQVYMLQKSGYRLSQATNIIIQDFIIYQFSLVFITTLAVIINSIIKYYPQTALLTKLTILGYILNLGVAIVLILVSYSSKFLKKAFIFLEKLLIKWKILKEDAERQERFLNRFDDFSKGAANLRKNKKTIILGLLYNVLCLLALFIIPLFAFWAIDSTIKLPVLETLVASAYIALVSAFIPTPGATGGAEYSFLQFFGQFAKAGVLSAIMLIWRFITYYLGLLVGAIILNFTGDEYYENRSI